MTLPEWLVPLPDAAQQRALDAWAIETHGIPGLELMERAGLALADACDGSITEGGIAVVCGSGNNGGDGFVAARLLLERGRDVRVLLLAEADTYKGDARANLERLPSERVAAFTPEPLAAAGLVVDALLGTGFSGEPREPLSGAIAAINAARDANGDLRVVACDVPSGVDASTGEVLGEAVRADLTVTFNAAKPGLLIAPGKRHAGRVRVVDIGIPDADQPVAPNIGRIQPAVRDQVPRRAAASNKFNVGSVLVCGGSKGLTGAPVMAATAAARAGAGYVTVAVPASVSAIVAGKLLEIMTVELPDDGDHGLKRGTSRMVVERAARAGALVLGPGLGRQPATVGFARAVASYTKVPLVLDADGLNAHAEEDGLEQLKQREPHTVLTPHAGELARLLHVQTSEVDAGRLSAARECAQRSGAIVVLKGDDTIVAAPDGTAAISPGEAPALATAGTGDVLAGVVGAFLAKGLDPFTAACAAVMIHVKAGRIAAREVGEEGVIATDVIAALPRALARPRSVPGQSRRPRQSPTATRARGED
jgi:NAD(P)H-hydrate epimerase